MDFIDLKPRERAGASTSGKYDYQKDLSICMLLEYHEKSNDYLFIFDYHDDLVIFDSETTPNKYAFFQIKSKTGGCWTLKTILRRSTGKEGKKLNSILGKMYSHTKNFSGKTASINLLSNEAFTITKKGSTKAKSVPEVCLEDLNTQETNLIINSIKEEFSPDSINEDFLKLTFLKVHDLSVKDSSTHTKGQLSEFLNKRAQGKKYNVESIYTTIFDEVRIKTIFKEEVTSFQELKDRKGIGKSNLDELLKLIGERKDYDSFWTEINALLIAAQVNYGEIRQYKSLWKQIELERMNPVNRVLRECIKDVDQIIHRIGSAGFIGLNIVASCQLVLTQFNTQGKTYPFNKEYLETLIFAELHE